MDSVLDDFEELEDTMATEIAKATLGLHSELIRVAPVGTPETTGIKGYVGGFFKASWKADKNSKMSWTIKNNAEYASFLWRGHSKQWAGGDSMLAKANIDLTRKLDSIRIV